MSTSVLRFFIFKVFNKFGNRLLGGLKEIDSWIVKFLSLEVDVLNDWERGVKWKGGEEGVRKVEVSTKKQNVFFFVWEKEKT